MDDIREIKRVKDDCRELFFSTGNFYYYLIVRDLNKIIQLKLENEKRKEEETNLEL